MAKTMEQYMSKTRADYGSGIARPKIDDKDSFELKGQFLKELRDNTFSGSDHEDANEHIEKVLEIVDLFHIPNITQDQVMLRAFPMSLTGAASRWLRNKPSGSITTWEDLKTKFLSKYCPPARTAKKMEEINNFQQEPDETLYQAWERFKELLMKCPQHYLTEMQEVILFYNGLDIPTRQILDSKGAIASKTVVDAKDIFIRASRLKKILLEVMAELISEECIVNAQNESNISIIGNDINIELSDEFLVELQKNAYHGWIDEDLIDHIAKMNGSWNKRRMNGIILSSNNTTTDSFFKPYLITRGKCNTEKEDEQSQMKRKYSNTSKSIDEKPNKGMCKAKKFEAIQYSLGPNE
ncbi:hypothetical protein Tco_1376247 [Tanacetum coccineum]